MSVFNLQKCTYCGKDFYRDFGWINESVKKGWRVFCSQQCLFLSRTTSKIYICFRPGCGKKFRRRPSDFKKTKNPFCSNSCSAKYYNSFKKKKVRICPSCGNKFTGYRIYCSSECIPKHESKYTKEIVIKIISDFFIKNGRIPLKREMYGCYKVARKFFGTWNKAIEVAGFEPNPVMFSKKYFANDGHKCDSLAEKIIDDYLYARKIKHIRSFPYPGDKKFTVDFKIGDCWVEFFGLSGQLKRYDELILQKLELVGKYKLKLIKLYLSDLFPKNKLSEKLVFVK